MAQEQKRTTAECRQEVQRRVKAEYEEFLKRYQNLPEKVRFQAMVNDAEKIAFYRDFYIIVVIIEPFYPRDWRWFYEYYLGQPIIADFYESHKAFEKDLADLGHEEEKRSERCNTLDEGFINAYVQSAQANAQVQGLA
jgi:hypothetical protein